MDPKEAQGHIPPPLDPRLAAGWGLPPWNVPPPPPGFFGMNPNYGYPSMNAMVSSIILYWHFIIILYMASLEFRQCVCT